MKSVNIVTLLGNVTNAPEVKALPSGQMVCKFGLATNRVWKDADGQKQELPEFHNLVTWGRLAESSGKFVKKGRPLFVQGHLRTGKWEAKGAKHQRTEVIVENLVYLDAKKKELEAEEVAVA